MGVEPPPLPPGPLGDARRATGVDVEDEQLDVFVTREEHGGGAPHRPGPEDRDTAHAVTLRAGRATGP